MKLLLAAVMAAALLASSTVQGQSNTAAAAEPEVVEVAGGNCISPPKVPFFSSMKECKVPAPIGSKCSISCAKNPQASFESLPAPTATCTDKGWVVENPCRRVCLGAPDAALLDKSRGVWPSNCADHTLTAGECKAICYHGGAAKLACGQDGKWAAKLEGECKPHPRLAAMAQKAGPQQQQQQKPAPAAAAAPTKDAAKAPQQQQSQQPQQQQPQQQQQQQQQPKAAPAPAKPITAPVAAKPVNLLGASVDGVLVGGSPSAQTATRVNYFDPGRVLVRPPDFMNIQVLNENGNNGIIVDPKLTEFGAFIGSKDYQLGQFADIDADSVTVHYAHSGGHTCVEAAAVVLRSPAFAGLKASKVVDEFGDAAKVVDVKGGRVSAVLKGNELNVWVPGLCFKQPATNVKAVIKLMSA